jgi:hypothetical protein
MTSGGPDAEELLSPSPPFLPRRIRRLGVVLVVLGVVIGLAVALWPNGQHRRPVAAPSGTASKPTTTPAPGPSSGSPVRHQRRWPTAPTVCGGRADLPIVNGAVPVRGRTGISVVLGGARLARLDFDSGRIVRPVKSPVRRGEVVTSVSGGNSPYVITYNCGGPDVEGPQLLRITSTGAVTVPVPQAIDQFLIDGEQVWGVHWSTTPAGRSRLIPVDGGRAVRLPAGFFPYGVTAGVVIGSLATSSNHPGALLLVDTRTGAVRRNLGRAGLLAAADGVVVWTTGCAIGSPAACEAHRQDVSGGLISHYSLTHSPSASTTAISDDGKLVAFTMQRPQFDPRFVADHPFPPADVAILHLDTGVVSTVPGIEIPAKSAPALGFTSDNWLVMALGAGNRTRVLAWRVGLAHAVESRAVPGLVGSPPALQVLAPRASSWGSAGR